MKNHATGRWTIGSSRQGSGGQIVSGSPLSATWVLVLVIVVIVALGVAGWRLSL